MKINMQNSDSYIEALNLYFDKIYLLTIARNISRINLCRENLKAIDFSVFMGVDGKELDLDELEKAGKYNRSLMRKNNNDYMVKYIGVTHSYDPNPNMVACSLSHRMIYEDIIKNSYKRVLILEDDAVLMEDNLKYFVSMTAQLPDNWDVFYLGYDWKHDPTLASRIKRLYIYPVINFLGIRKYNSSAIKNGFAKPYSKNVLIAGTHAGTHAYAITQRGAEIMLGYQSPVQNNPDLAFWELSMQGKINSYSAIPKLFSIAGGPSTIL